MVYSAHRNTRPWQGAGRLAHQSAPAYDPQCYLCPGNNRVHGHTNPSYSQVFIFDNDHPVVGMDSPEVEGPVHSLFVKEKATGIARVVCYDPAHNMTLSKMSLEKVVSVFQAFRDQTEEMIRHQDIRFVLIFENKGAAVGVSNPHPHCQIYATDFVFTHVARYLAVADKYRNRTSRNIFDDILQAEQQDGVRILSENKSAIAFIPFFARYAYEVMIFPKRRVPNLVAMSPGERADLASVFHEVVRKLDMNFDMDFPYVMNVMQAPVDGKEYPEYAMHLWIQPPYRQPGLIKYLAGPEIGGGNFMADTMPEEKAAELRKINIEQYRPQP